jgi:hypothetical protein
VTYANAGTYDVILTVTNSFGTETLTTSNAVSVNTTPNVSISAGTQQLCEGSTTQITASGATSYTWDSGLGVGSTQTVSPTQTTTYTVTGSNGLACEATESITITVNTLPTVVASSDATICSGNTVQISASGASSYLWDNGAGNGAIQNVTPTQTTVYTVTGTDANNCSNTDNVTITVEDVPTVTVSSSNLSICPGGTVSMTASGADSYIWSPTSGLSSATSAAVVATPSTTTTYTVEGTNNCGTDTEDITVTVLPTPTTPVITQTGNTLSVTLQAGETATWAYNGFPAGTGSSITMQGDGIYLVTITNANGCESSNSGSYEMDVTSVQEIGLDALLNLYPNPTKGMFTVEFGEHEGLQIDVTDALGRSVVRTIQVETGNTQTAVDISHCSPGIYNVVIQTNRGKINRKVTLH